MKKALPGILLVLVLAGASSGGWYWYRGKSAEGEVRYRTAKVERGPLTAVVAASGTLNAVTTVQVGAQISGQVKDIYADFNTAVKKDQVIARIDPSTFELRVNQARADVDAADSVAAVARSGQAAAQAEAGRVRAALLDAQRDFDRKKLLVEKKFISGAELDRARAALDGARERLKSAEAQQKASEAQASSALAAVKQRQSLLRQAQADLERTVIRAPVDGTVILRNVDAGQTVAAGRQAPVLFTIAQDLRDMQVEAAIDEADVGRLKAGLAASFSVDAFPRRSFPGEIRQIRKSPAGAQNAVGYAVVISAANPDLALLPGMTANVRVTVDSRQSVLKLPNAALRFGRERKLDDEQKAKLEEILAEADGGRASLGRVWVLREGEPAPLDVRLGLTDGAFTEIVAGPLAAGADVIVGVVGRAAPPESKR
jgi:HlyD family secretion protein